MKALSYARAVAFVLLLGLTLWAMPWSYLPLLFANLDTQAILTRTELRRVMGPLILAVVLGVAWLGFDAWLSLRIQRPGDKPALPESERATVAAGPSAGKPSA